MTDQRRTTLVVFISIAGFQALLTMIALLRIPAGTENAVFLGFSAQRWALLSLPAALLALAALGLFKVRRGHPFFHRSVERLATGRLMGRLLLAAGVIAFLAGIAILVTLQDTPFVLAPRGDLAELEIDSYYADLGYFSLELYQVRLLPLLSLMFGLSVQTFLLLPGLVLGWQEFGAGLRSTGFPAVLAVFAAGAAALFWAFAQLKQLGPDTIGWNTIGSPILETQAAAVFFLALSAAGTAYFAGRKKLVPDALRRRGDGIVVGLIWIIALLHWTSIPLQPSWYLASPKPPLNTLIPASDALVYDLTAQNMLVGEGLRTYSFDNVTVRRPLFTFVLGLLQAVGDDLYTVAALQSAILALFPAVLYLLGRDLHSRLAGLATAGLLILREGNAIALADQITVAHPRLFMSDLPAALGVALFIWLAQRWLSEPDRGLKRPLLAGAVLGGLGLIRFETFLLLPVTALIALLAVKGAWRRIFPGIAWMTVGLVVALAPWLMRNYLATGQIFIEVPGNRLSYFSFRFSKDLPADSPRVDPRVIEQAEMSRLERAAAHYLHNNIQGVLILPSALRAVDAGYGYLEQGKADQFLESCCSRSNYVRRFPFWQWNKWDLVLPPEASLPILVNLFLLAAGLVSAVRRRGAAALLPFLFAQAHYLINAAARTSGGRYMVPADWVWPLYYAIGLCQLVRVFLRLWSRSRLPAWMVGTVQIPGGQPAGSLRAGAVPVLAVLACSTVLPLGERMFPRLYPDIVPAAWVSEMSDAAGPEMAAFMEAEETRLVYGRALYPRYYGPGAGEAGTTFPNLYAADSLRATFFIAGPTSTGVVLAVDSLPEFAWPAETDILVAGCVRSIRQVEYVEALSVYFPESGELLVSERFSAGISCASP